MAGRRGVSSGGLEGPGGPYETAAAADAASGYEGLGWEELTGHNRKRLGDAVRLAGVEVCGFDRRVLEWLASQEPGTVEVVASLIERAAGAGAGTGRVAGPAGEG